MINVTFKSGFHWHKIMTQAYHMSCCTNLGNLSQEGCVIVFHMPLPCWKETIRLTKDDGKEGHSKGLLLCWNMFICLALSHMALCVPQFSLGFFLSAHISQSFWMAQNCFVMVFLSSFHGFLRHSKCIHRISKHGIWWDWSWFGVQLIYLGLLLALLGVNTVLVVCQVIIVVI